MSGKLILACIDDSFNFEKDFEWGFKFHLNFVQIINFLKRQTYKLLGSCLFLNLIT